jgi:hypothetical protein
MNCSIACLLKIDSNLSIYPYTHKYILFEAREVIASLSFFFVSVFSIRYMYVCTKRWRSSAARMIYLPWKFIHLRCLLWRLSCIYSKRVYLSIAFRHEEKKNNKKRKKCEAFLFISLILLIVQTFFFSLFFCLFIHKAYSAETLTRNSLLTFFLCRPPFFLAYVSHTNWNDDVLLLWR